MFLTKLTTRISQAALAGRVNQNVLYSFIRKNSSDSTVADLGLEKASKRGARPFNQSAYNSPSPIYELRIYNIHPKDFKRTVMLFQKHISTRTRHSKLLGFWNGEIGGSITQLIHLWEYESLSHRRSVRTGMMDDDTWTSVFLPALLPAMDSWGNTLLALAPNSSITRDFTNNSNAVYQLEILKRDEESDLERLKSDPKRAGETLVGRFFAIIGQSNMEYRLWRYSHIDDLLTGAWHRTLADPTEGSSLLLYPLGFSPIQ
ncbi:unnamed protein product [Lymnaea stagnalis]|uniref:NIPSNAP domain-containing protein n=1 Tax=Lymnaea stagnalis TaxID=6523 RepID=A0AAV2HW25_LYMST